MCRTALLRPTVVYRSLVAAGSNPCGVGNLIPFHGLLVGHPFLHYSVKSTWYNPRQHQSLPATVQVP